MVNRIFAALVAGACVAAAPVMSVAQTTEPVSFTLNNQTDNVLVALYISVVSTNEWEEDIFGSGVLGAGDSVEITIDDNLSDCEYDLKAVFDDGEEVILGSEDFCELDGGEVNVTD